jgi:oxaloacetate decarboxylase beta subunit
MFQEYGLKNELFPLLMFLVLGALIDFTSILQRPQLVLLGAAAQFGIFGTLIGGLVLVNILPGVDPSVSPLRVAASIAVIGSADGPSTIYVSSQLLKGTVNEALLGPIATSAYTYMAMVPLIQPPIMRLLTTRRERQVVMEYNDKPVSRRVRLLFPISCILVTTVLAPQAGPLIGLLMVGNLLRESGVVERLSKAAQNELTNLVTVFLGLAVGSTMTAEAFLQPLTIGVFLLGLVAFSLATASGVLFGKAMYLLSGRKINPLVGAAGLSAFPMSARVVNQVGLQERPDNYLLMHAVPPNVAGQLGSAIAAGVLLSFFL